MRTPIPSKQHCTTMLALSSNSSETMCDNAHGANVHNDETKKDCESIAASSVYSDTPCLSSTNKYVVILMGLPASGKSTVAGHLINFLGINCSTETLRCKTFNAGDYRRKASALELASNPSDDVFNPKNSEKKDKFARLAFSDALQSLNNDSCDLALFDATNSTTKRREYLFNEINSFNTNPSARYTITPLVFDVTCTNKSMIRYNIHRKAYNNDYADKVYDAAIKDFTKRLQQYQSQYVPYTVSEFRSYDNYEQLEKLQLSNGSFYFHVGNAGRDQPSNQLEFTPHVSGETAKVVHSIDYFTSHYYMMYGRIYLTKVHEFFSIPRVISANKFNWPKTKEHMHRLMLLHRIVDRSFVKSLDDFVNVSTIISYSN